MAQFVMQDLVNKAGLADVLRVDSAATTNDEIGHSPHHGTVDKLKQVGVPVLPHRARKVRADEYDEWDLFVYMDDENERHLSGAGRRGREDLARRAGCPRDRASRRECRRRGRSLVHRQLRRHLPRRVGRLQRPSDLVSGAIVGSLHTQKGLRARGLLASGETRSKKVGRKSHRA